MAEKGKRGNLLVIELTVHRLCTKSSALMLVRVGERRERKQVRALRWMKQSLCWITAGACLLVNQSRLTVFFVKRPSVWCASTDSCPPLQDAGCLWSDCFHARALLVARVWSITVLVSRSLDNCAIFRHARSLVIRCSHYAHALARALFSSLSPLHQAQRAT